jgi:hypothetical protein
MRTVHPPRARNWHISSNEIEKIFALAFKHLMRLSSTLGGRLAPIMTIIAGHVV